jgi:hypothetical protein
MYSKNKQRWTKNSYNWTKNRSIAYTIYNDTTHLKINLNIGIGYRILKIDTFRLKIDQGGRGHISSKNRLISSKSRYCLIHGIEFV